MRFDAELNDKSKLALASCGKEDYGCDGSTPVRFERNKNLVRRREYRHQNQLATD